MNLQIADRPTFLFDDPCLDVVACKALFHLGPHEGLVVPVARDVRVRMPRDEAVDVTGARRPQRCQSSVYVKSH